MNILRRILRKYKIIQYQNVYLIAYKYPWQKIYQVMNYYSPYKEYKEAMEALEHEKKNIFGD